MILIAVLATSMVADIGSPIPMAPSPAQTLGKVSYATLLAHVKAGGRGMLYVGVPPGRVPQEYTPCYCVVQTLGDVTPGVYLCEFLDGKPLMERLENYARLEPPASKIPTINPLQSVPLQAPAVRWFPLSRSDCPTGNCPLR